MVYANILQCNAHDSHLSYHDIILNLNHRLHLFKYWPLHSGIYQNAVTNCIFFSLTTSCKIGLHGQGRHPAKIRTKLELQNNDRARNYTSNIMIVIVAYTMLLCRGLMWASACSYSIIIKYAIYNYSGIILCVLGRYCSTVSNMVKLFCDITSHLCVACGHTYKQ